ncbi:MAG: molybdate ABC transporter substrate-binding protein [Actinomycetota bacterium]
MTTRRARCRRRLAAAIVLALVAAGCGGPGDDDRTVLRVSAAASLTDAMADIEQYYEESVATDVDLQVNLAGSATIRAQLLEGAPADVVITANPAIMDDLAAAGIVSEPPTTVATNHLVLAVPGDNPAVITELSDLTDPELFVGLCARGVPCGDLADEALAAAGLEITADTREPDVRSLLAKVGTGELDAGLVYLTDIVGTSGADVVGIDLPPELVTTTSYPIAVVASSPNLRRATQFIEVLTDGVGRTILTEHGFGAP